MVARIATGREGLTCGYVKALQRLTKLNCVVQQLRESRRKGNFRRSLERLERENYSVAMVSLNWAAAAASEYFFKLPSARSEI